MDELSLRLKSITVGVREVSLFCLCCVATYLLRVRHSYSIEPAWRVDSDQSLYVNGHYAQQWEIIPSALVTDVESDELNELLIVTKEPNLQLLKIPKHSQQSKVLPFMQLQNEVTLVTGNASLSDRQPKALATGYLEPYQSMLQVRKQVIVVVTADWTVLCFDHNLNLLWETKLMTVSIERYFIREISIQVTSHIVKADDGGLVIIGASLRDRYHKEAKIRHDHKKPDQRHVHREEEDEEEDQDEEGQKKAEPVVNHFSTFALSGHDGSIRWHHLPGDFGERTITQEELFSAHHFKLALRKGLSHAGEQQWNQYTHAILKQLPHRWQRGYDTSLLLARIVKDNVKTPQVDTSNDGVTLPSLIGLDGEHIAGYHFGGLRPHSPTEHVKNPNAVVIHMHEGIEVLDLATGRPLTRLKLSNDVATYADVDNDGTIDQVRASFTDDSTHRDNCMAIVKSGIPPHTMLFNGSICEAHAYMDAVAGSLFGRTTIIQENLKLAIAPLVVPSIAKQSGVINHLLGTSMLQKSRGRLDSIFLVSNGRVTSYGPSGRINWQVDTNIKWNTAMTIFKNKHHFPKEIMDRYHNAFQPGMQVMALQVFGKLGAVALVGWDHLDILSLEDGHQIAHHSLPCQPTAPLVIGDFNSDGYNDVILQCSSGILGFRLELYSAYWSTAVIGLCLVAIVLGLTKLCSSDHHFFDEDPSEGQTPPEYNHFAR
ncbi:uncharacterized protein LOC117288891 [Asterias rubens]|uniref:uncharacterized protein LOC117288891 n=1 Tax=Asterias rubens TaxID=7604 RepID=UPI00145555F9|nr:uncharacterized protein LOC117288891 [Asterias rubens]